MDALKYVPDNVNVLRTEKGDARLQKTDIFKKLMWFSYPREESWIPLTLTRVKEVQQMNRDGILPPDLGEVKEVETKPVKVLDYENVVGQDSLTRLDERRNQNKKKNNKNRNKNHKPNGAPDGGPRPQEAGAVQNQQAVRTPAARTDDRPNNNPNRHKKFRPNPNRNNQNRGGQQDKPQ